MSALKELFSEPVTQEGLLGDMLIGAPKGENKDADKDSTDPYAPQDGLETKKK